MAEELWSNGLVNRNSVMDEREHLTAISVAQLSVVSADPEANFVRAETKIKQLEVSGEHIIVFPECYLTGYVTDSFDQTAERALTRDHSIFTSIRDLSTSTRTHLAIGYLENDRENLFNSLVLSTASGELYHYRKQHLLRLGADAFTTAGDVQDAVVNLPLGPTGMMICYDLRFPEAARRLALEGAQLIVMPTNWPATATILAEHFAPVRAAENGVFLAIANRPDTEAGMQFLGRSQIIDPDGSVLVDAGTEEGIYTARVPISRAASKQRVVSSGEYEYNLFADRRPELYGPLSSTILSSTE